SRLAAVTRPRRGATGRRLARDQEESARAVPERQHGEDVVTVQAWATSTAAPAAAAGGEAPSTRARQHGSPRFPPAAASPPRSTTDRRMQPCRRALAGSLAPIARRTPLCEIGL